MADENVSDRVLTRDDELRLFALQIATKDRFDFSKSSPDDIRARVLADSAAYYAFLTDKEPATDG